MAGTTPLPLSTFDRISSRLKAVQPKLDSSATHRNMIGLAGSAPECHPLRERDTVFLIISPVSLVEVLTEVRTVSLEGSTDTDTLIERSDLEAFLSKSHIDSVYEWDEYPEPLWDPLKSEIRLLVREYFEQADADSD